MSYRDENGDRVFENATEAMFSISDWTYDVLRWLKQLRDEYGIQLPGFPQAKSQLHDIAMVTKRFIAVQKREIDRLRAREQELLSQIHEIREDTLCPRCGKPKQVPKEG